MLWYILYKYRKTHTQYFFVSNISFFHFFCNNNYSHIESGFCFPFFCSLNMFLPYVLITTLHILFSVYHIIVSNFRVLLHCLILPQFSSACQSTFAQLKCALKSRQQCDPQIAVNSLRSAYKLILKNHNGGTARGIEWALTFRLAGENFTTFFFATVGSLTFRSTRNVKTSLHATKFWKAVGRFNWSSFLFLRGFRKSRNFFLVISGEIFPSW